MALVRDVAGRVRAEIRGIVSLDGIPTVAPASGTPCAFWHLAIDAGYGFHLLSAWDGIDFVVADESGRARVLGREASYRLRRTQTFIAEGNLPREVARILEARGIVGREWLRLREQVLIEGAKVTVSGYADHEADPTPAPTGYRERAMRLILSRRPDIPLTVHEE